MKRLLIALLLCLVFSAGAEARKVTMSADPLGGLDMAQGSDTSSGVPVATCEYTCIGETSAFVHVRRGMSVNLKVLAGDAEMSLYSRLFDSESTFTTKGVCPAFAVVQGTDWTLAWTIETSQGKKGKVRVVDAMELASGTCQ